MTGDSPKKSCRKIGLPWRIVPSVRALEARVQELEQANSAREQPKTALTAHPQEIEHHFRGPTWTATHPGKPTANFIAPILAGERKKILDDFHRMFYDLTDANSYRTYFVSWLGYEMFKWPFDLWIYQEIIVRTRPDVIIETGTYRGGSALFLASLCDLMQQGEVVTVDLDESQKAERPLHPRITYLTGSSTDPAIVDRIMSIVAGRTNVMAILDADHSRDHVLAELRIYSQFVPPNGYLVAEDSNINGHPVYPEFGPGPWEAVEQFLSENPNFFIDRDCERFLLTANPGGFLRRRGTK
jgi:cephalosporin hydroxylase